MKQIAIRHELESKANELVVLPMTITVSTS